MGHGGARKGAGPKAGGANSKTVALQRAVEEAVGKLVEPFEGDSYAFLALVYKDTRLPFGLRMDAAKTIIAYERPRLSQIEMTARSVDQLSDEEFFRE
jgi:hypothetical protein